QDCRRDIPSSAKKSSVQSLPNALQSSRLPFAVSMPGFSFPISPNRINFIVKMIYRCQKHYLLIQVLQLCLSVACPPHHGEQAPDFGFRWPAAIFPEFKGLYMLDRKSTRLNSSHVKISYAVYCLK